MNRENITKDNFIEHFQMLSDSDLWTLHEEGLFDMLEKGFIILKREPTQYSIIYANPILKQFLGNSVFETSSDHAKSYLSLIYLFDITNATRALDVTVTEGYHQDTYRLQNANEENFWMMALHRYIQYEGEKYIFICFNNVQEFIGSHKKLQEDKQQLSDIVNSVPIGLIIFSRENKQTKTIALNDRLIELSNQIGELIYGASRNWNIESLTAALDDNIFAFCAEDDIPKVRDMFAESKTKQVTECIFQLRGSNADNPIWIRCTCSSKEVSDGKYHYYVTYDNVTENVQNSIEVKKNHEELYHMSYHDALTGLFNRNAYNEALSESKIQTLQNTGVIFSDVNGLKNTNDTMGHIYGDNLICDYADLLKMYIPNQHIYRISGDEFIVIIPNIEQSDFKERCHDLMQAIKKANDIASVGYSWNEEIADLGKAIAKAEQLMYVEKQRYYATREQVNSKHRPKFLKQFLQELAEGYYHLYLQPKSNINNHEVIGAEALVRKIDEQGIITYPDKFIPHLEYHKLIPKLDFYMLEQTCRLLKRWEKEGRKPIKISVNMSRVTLAEYDFIQHMSEICEKYEVNPSLLEFEITESTQTMSHHRLMDEVAEIRDMEYGVSLDDMGTDYSSLKMLLIDGIDTIKLDRSFILKMDTKKGHVLLKHVIDMSHDLGLKCIAEGVEDENQRQQLLEMGCDYYQGYMLSKPIPVQEFEERFL